MNNITISQKDHTFANVIFCIFLVLVVSLQALIPLVLVFSFIPIPVAPIIHELFPRYFEQFYPKRDAFFYHCWIGMVFLGQGVLLACLKDRLNSPTLIKQLRTFFIVECLWLFLMVFASFKFFVYGYPAWALHLLYAVLAGCVLSKLFWKELCEWAKAGFAYLTGHPKIVGKNVDFFFPLVIIGLIFVPDIKGVLARMWIGDDLIHWDTTLMGQAWGWSKGAVLNVDIYTHYGLGMPIFVALITKAFGNFTYTGVLSVLIWATVIYFILCYFFLRKWFKNVPIAIAGTLLAIKWQMFHQGNYPFVFTYPYSTVCRNFFDIIVLFLLLAHIRRGNFYLLATAGAIVGLALFYISDTGVYLLVAFLFYLSWAVLEAKVHKSSSWKKTAGRAALCLGIVLLSAFCWLDTFQGPHVWSKVFWGNMGERIAFFLAGHGDVPMYQSLVDGDYLVSWMGFCIPLVYVGVLTAIISLIVLRKIHRRHIMAAVICIYGMGSYHYYTYRSAGTAFDTVCIPFVFVLCWLFSQWVENMSILRRHVWEGALLGLSAFALFSTHAFLSYPNIFNFSPNPIVAPTVKWPNKSFPFYFDNVPRNLNPMLKLPLNSLGSTDEGLKTEDDFKTDKELESYFSKEFDYSKDAELIDSLTSKDQPVPLLSDFETRILMQADRRPFFYYFPIIDSSPRRMRIWPFSKLWTVHSLNKTMDQFEQEKPPYVFMEKIFLYPQVPKIYEYLYPDFLYIVAYLHKNYQPYKYGEYLVALKRIDLTGDNQ